MAGSTSERTEARISVLGHTARLFARVGAPSRTSPVSHALRNFDTASKRP